MQVQFLFSLSTAKHFRTDKCFLGNWVLLPQGVFPFGCHFFKINIMNKAALQMFYWAFDDSEHSNWIQFLYQTNLFQKMLKRRTITSRCGIPLCSWFSFLLDLLSNLHLYYILLSAMVLDQRVANSLSDIDLAHFKCIIPKNSSLPLSNVWKQLYLHNMKDIEITNN